VDLDEITPPAVRTWRAERLGVTGATTVAKAYRLLKAILQTAADDELIPRNPCRIRGAGKESAPERPIATVAQVDALADAMGPRWRLMVYLAAYGPTRPEELAALRRLDVDTEDVGVWIRSAEPELATGRRAPGDTKSDAGRRFLALPEFMRKDLERHLSWYAEKKPNGLLSWGRRVLLSGARRSGGNGGGPAQSSGCRTTSVSTTSGTPGTPCPRAAARRSGTPWWGPGSPRSVRP
jgi:integrase